MTTVSVVIAWVNPLEWLVPGLRALLQGQTRPPLEVIVVTRHAETQRARLCDLFPRVTLVVAPPHTSIPALRALGLRRAQGNMVAVTEDHCVPGPEWIERIEGWATSGAAAVGGPVENGRYRRWRDWAAFLTEYAAAMPPATSQPSATLPPGNNIAYRREHLAGLIATLEEGRWESFYHHRLQAAGAQVVFDPQLVIVHQRPFGCRYFMCQRFHFSRSFAAMRVQSLPSSARLAYGLGSLGLPPLLLWRVGHALWARPRLVHLFLLCLPLIGMYVSVGALGEMTGYILGGADSLERVE